MCSQIKAQQMNEQQHHYSLWEAKESPLHQIRELSNYE